MAGWGWGHGKEKSWGNGIIRVSLKEAIAVLMAVMALYGAWKDLKSEVRQWHMDGASRDEQLQAALTENTETIRHVEDRVLVLETKLNRIGRSRIFSPKVKVVETK